MILYFDTSALVKLFSEEKGSEQVKELINDPTNEIWVLELALIELISATFRKYRDRQIDGSNLSQIQEAIKLQFEFFNVSPISSNLLDEAGNLLTSFGKEFGLRTLDALHIAGWHSISEQDWVFVSSDKNQLKVVENLNYKTIPI